MIRLNRTTEYGLIALRYIHQKTPTELTSAREVADAYGLPFEIMAKTLQRLKELGLIISTQGARGGYTTGKALSGIHLAEFIAWMEGNPGIVSCLDTGNCDYQPRCEIQHLMGDLNGRIHRFLSGISLAELVSPRSSLQERTSSYAGE